MNGFQKFEAGTPPIAEVIGLSASLDFINEVGINKIVCRVCLVLSSFLSGFWISAFRIGGLPVPFLPL